MFSDTLEKYTILMYFNGKNYLVLLKMSSFWTGRIWTANCSFKALFDQEFYILLQALKRGSYESKEKHQLPDMSRMSFHSNHLGVLTKVHASSPFKTLFASYYGVTRGTKTGFVKLFIQL